MVAARDRLNAEPAADRSFFFSWPFEDVLFPFWGGPFPGLGLLWEDIPVLINLRGRVISLPFFGGEKLFVSTFFWTSDRFSFFSLRCFFFTTLLKHFSSPLDFSFSRLIWATPDSDPLSFSAEKDSFLRRVEIFVADFLLPPRSFHVNYFWEKPFGTQP